MLNTTFKYFSCLVVALCISAAFDAEAAAKQENQETAGLLIPVSRSELVIVQRDISEIVVADPEIADVHVIGSKRVVLIGKKLGRTNAKFFDKANAVIRQFDITVGYDLPAIRAALHFFLPRERIAVNLVNSNIALTGEVSDATVADKAMRIVNQFVTQASAAAASSTASSNLSPNGDSGVILNLLKVTSGQQVMLRVRIGEVQRDALKKMGISLSALAENGKLLGATLNKVSVFDKSSDLGVGGLLRGDANSGFLLGTLTSGGFSISAALEALETDGLLKLLAEPNLVAMSGEKAEFLAGGQFPVVIPQSGGSGGGSVNTVQFQQYGVSVQFIPTVLSETRVRIAVQPEVSEIDGSGTLSSSVAPALITRRVKTTVELAPGESFMIAGLMSDRFNSGIKQIPGASSIPVLGALLRSTSYQRRETELVIAVTPYIVDPVKSTDIRFPSDDFRPASLMEQFFYGSLGAISGNEYHQAQMPSLEGPIGFITD